MHNGETIQKLAATVDKIHERHSRNAVKTVFTNMPRLGIVSKTQPGILERGFRFPRCQRDQRMTLGIPQIE